MAIAADLPRMIDVGGSRITLNPNKKEPRTRWQRIADYMDTAAGGPFRTLQLADRFFKLLNLVTPNEGFKDLSTVLNKSWTVTIIPRLPGATLDAIKDFVSLTSKPSDDGQVRQRQYANAFCSGTDAVCSWGYASSLVLTCFKKTATMGLSLLKPLEFITFTHDTVEGCVNAQDFNAARSLLGKAQEVRVEKDLENTIVDTQRFHLLKTLKAACSVGGFVLGLYMVSAGLVVPGLVVLAATISLVSSVFAMSASLLEEGMEYNRIKFFRPVA